MRAERSGTGSRDSAISWRRRSGNEVTAPPRCRSTRCRNCGFGRCLDRLSNRTNRNLVWSRMRPTRRRVDLDWRFGGGDRCYHRRARQESPPILVEEDRAPADLPGAQPAGCDLVIDVGAANRAVIRKLADRISERRYIGLGHLSGTARKQQAIGGSSPSHLAGPLRHAGLPSYWKIVPRRLAANNGGRRTWVVSANLSTLWTDNSAQ
jgi:hypothetical protein